MNAPALVESDRPLQRSDEELVTVASQGDLAAFGLLYDRYYCWAVGIAYSRLSDRHLAEDAAQEAFVVAYRTLATLQDRERFPQWLGTICRRTASRLALARTGSQPLPENLEPASDVTREQLRLDVREALEHLDELSREIVLLHYFSGLTYEEISRVLELTPQAIHGRLQRARRKLAEVLDPAPTSGEL